MLSSARRRAAALSTLAGGPAVACRVLGARQQQQHSNQSNKGPIKIAVADAQSGQLSSLGAWELKGVRLAVDEWNAAGGINGRQIELGVFDDQGDPTVGTNLATQDRE